MNTKELFAGRQLSPWSPTCSALVVEEQKDNEENSNIVSAWPSLLRCFTCPRVHDSSC